MISLIDNWILLSNWIHKLIVLFSFLILFLLSVFSVSLSAEISIWFIASEYIKGPYPSDQQIEGFKMRYPYADIDIGKDTNISWAVLLQNERVLQLIELFKQNLKNDNEKTELDELTIRVKFISWHANPLERIERCAISEGIDIVQIGSTWTAYLADKGILSDISSLAKSIEDKYTPCLLKSCKIENKYCYYAIPWSLDIRTWFYNRKLFEKADLDPDKALGSLAGLGELCRILKERFIDKPGFWPICVPTDRKDYSTLHNALPWIWGYGGKLIDIQNQKGNLLDDRVIKGMTEYVNLAAKGYAPLPCRDGYLTLLDAQNNFLEGNVALIFIGPWIKEAILTNRHPEQFENKGSIKAPYGECPTSLIGGSNLAIIESPRNSFEEMISQKLIRFLSLNGGLGIGLPPCKESLKRLITSEAEPYLKPFATILLYQEANTYPSLPEWGHIEQIMVNYIARIWEIVGIEDKLNNSPIGKDIEIFSAKTIEDGKKTISMGGCDIVVLDLNLPPSIGKQVKEGGGKDLISFIKNHSPSARIVLLTGETRIKLQDQYLNEDFPKGIDDYILKDSRSGYIKQIVKKISHLVPIIQEMSGYTKEDNLVRIAIFDDNAQKREKIINRIKNEFERKNGFNKGAQDQYQFLEYWNLQSIMQENEYSLIDVLIVNVDKKEGH